MLSTYQSPLRSKPASTLTSKFNGRVLIACEDGQVAHELMEVLKRTSLLLERARDFASACKLLKTGKFQVVFSTPRVPGGSWQKLMDFARDSGRPSSFVIVARSFDLSDWANCLKDGAFEVLDSISEISRAGAVAIEAFSVDIPMARQGTARREILELHDLSQFSAKHPEAAT